MGQEATRPTGSWKYIGQQQNQEQARERNRIENKRKLKDSIVQISYFEEVWLKEQAKY